MNVHFEVGRDELKDACLILADACLGFSAVRADLFGLGHVMLDADLRQLIVVRLTSKARTPGDLLGGSDFKHGVDVACSVHDADDFNAIISRTVDDQVPLETFDPPYPKSGQAWMG